MREKKEGDREKRKGEGKRGEKRKKLILEMKMVDTAALGLFVGYLHTVDILLGHNGIDANVVTTMETHHCMWQFGGNSCLHLAVEREVFDSEDAPLDLLNECCTSLNLKIEERLSDVCCAEIKTATTKVHPCEHLLTCEECSNVPLKRCLRCLKPVTSRGRVAISLPPYRGRELEITDEDLQIVRHENPYNIVEQGYQMLLKWFQSCDPAKRTPQTLKEALLETECFVAAECLLSDFS
ncbi:E3 ubiquitin-protein ligase MIB1-like isoform X2 [Octopus vulgaris]|uniref:E3 ubiquitin-protein ligase MIB1-like isoform X2 n=1 Tax=Octopus vulgaris TaxID=6645 RepID=A0AA36HHR7_OCTVU|nr:E3 ubiquitin-protein ligase MIB1-like isoform X2 [Octopus vulgaris]